MTAAERVRAMLRGGRDISMPGVFDALSAHLAARAGFPVLFVSGFAVSAARLAAPDVGYLTPTETAAAVRDVHRAAGGLPVIADADTGYGNALSAQRTARELHAAGAAGIFLEDQEWPKRCGHMEGKRIVPAGEWLAKLRAVRDLREEGIDLFLVARTDARAAAGLAEAIARARAALAAGVDAVFVDAPAGPDEMRAVADATPGAVRVANMVEGGRTPLLGPGELHDLGYDLVVTPLTGLLAASRAMRDAYAALAREGTMRGREEGLLGFSEFTDLIGLPEHSARERRYAIADPQEREG